MVNSGQFDGLAGPGALEAVADYAERQGIGRRTINYKLKDWLISRQRYWGCPIPMIHCSRCGVVPAKEADLPVLLPEVEDYLPKGRSPLADVARFINVRCPECGGEAQRDPDTMDTFVCSSWYFLRYLDAHNEREPFAREKAERWMPVDLYVGGITHATGHLIYFRFFTKFLKDIGWLTCDEPATCLFNHGMVMDAEGEVMSKSKGNVISPIDLMAARGVDISRLAMFFVAPSEKAVLWSPDSVTGVEKFVTGRLYPMLEHLRGAHPDLKRYFKDAELSAAERRIYVKLNQTLKRVAEGFDKLQFNTAISALMELVRDYNPVEIGNNELNDQIILKTVQAIAPMAPHLAEEMWELAGFGESIFKSPWPDYDRQAVVGETIEIAVQVNGKLRATVTVPAGSDPAVVESAAQADPRVLSHIEGREIVKKIHVPGRLLNIVVRG